MILFSLMDIFTCHLTEYQVLKIDNAKVWGVAPGFLKTGLGNMDPAIVEKMGAEVPSIGGIFIKEVFEGAKDADVGKVVHAQGYIKDW